MNNTENSKKAKLYKFCAYRERSVAEVKQYALKTGIDNDKIEYFINDLTTQGFIDEYRFASSFVKGKMNVNKWGKYKIIAKLREKGVDDNIINKVINEFYDDFYMDILERLILKKINTIKNKETDCNVYIKLMRYALSKGFEKDSINLVIKNRVLSNK